MVDNVCMCNTYTTNFFEQPVGKEFCLPFTGLTDYFQIKISVYAVAYKINLLSKDYRNDLFKVTCL